MVEQIIEQPEDFEIKLGDTLNTPIYEKQVPEAVTQSAIGQETIPDETSPLGSTVIEDFILEKLKQGDTTTEQIVEMFQLEGMEEKVKKYIAGIRIEAEALIKKGIFTVDDFVTLRERVCTEMRALKMQEDQIERISSTEIKIGIEAGTSLGPTEDGPIGVNCHQALRHSMDYIQWFGNQFPVERLVKAIMTSTAGHELGHKIATISNGVNHIQPDTTWEQNGDSSENREERFAQFWGVAAMDDEDRQIDRKLWVQMVAKVDEVWKAIEQYNSGHEKKISISDIFDEIQEHLTDSEVMNFLHARELLYGGCAPENYALPYSRDTMERAIRDQE